MNYVLDIILAIVLIIAAIDGFSKGIIAQVCGIAGILLGILLAFRFSSHLAGWLKLGEGAAWLISFVIILIVVVLVLVLIGKLAKRFIHFLGLGIIDRIGGMALGIVKWGLVLSLLLGLLVNFANATKIINPELVTDSLLYKPLKKMGDVVFPYILDTKEKYFDPLEFPEDAEEEDVDAGRNKNT